MSAGLVQVVKEADGEEFSNTYCIMLGDDAVPLTEADLTAMVDLGTLGADQTAAVSPKVVNAILDFEMQYFPNFVNFRKVYVTDFFNAVEGPDANTIFLTKNLSIHGNAVPTDRDAIAPGNITLMVNKVPAGFSERNGACYYRLILNDADVSNRGLRLISWTDTDSATDHQARLAAALTSSGLSTHFAGGANVAGGVLAIPHFAPRSDPPTPQDGNLIGATPIVTMNVARPVGRQVPRGRKER